MAVVRDDEWENPQVICVKECERAPNSAEVKVRPIVRMKIEALMKKYTSREWLAYLIGHPEIDPLLVEDIVIPEQVATSANVDDVVIQDGLIPEGFKIIGVMHSHHNMNIGFSGTDENWINQNHDISILVSHKEIGGQVRYTTPCGAKKIVKCKVTVKHDIEFDGDAWIEEVSKNIKDRTYTPSNFFDGDWEGGYPYGGGGWGREGGTISREAVNRKTEDLFADIDREFTLEQELKAAFGSDENSDDDVFDTNQMTAQTSDDGPIDDDKTPGAGPEN